MTWIFKEVKLNTAEGGRGIWFLGVIKCEGVDKMNVKWAIFGFLVLFLGAGFGSECEAVNSWGIDVVRNKGVLGGDDFEVIDNFLAEAVVELVRTRDFTSTAKVRAVVAGRTNSNVESAEDQYAEQFSESAYKHIGKGLNEALRLESQERKFKVVMNLLILVNDLEDFRLTNLALDFVNDDNRLIRYWAVKCVTNPSIAEQLNFMEPANLKLAKDIAEALKSSVGNAGPEMISLTARFAANLDIQDGEELLVYIADARIKSYENWSVENELLETSILMILFDKMFSDGISNDKFARRFGQLYSHAIQRYIKGEGVLAERQKEGLISVLVEIEKTCIGKILRMPQSIIKRAIEQESMAVLRAECRRLFGDETEAGQLAVKLDFNYGTTQEGTRRLSPVPLPEPPGK